ncbi:DUF6210 family protein [Actinoplanes sp. NPDC049596]|uniref:DUF6210 family protein n=1 Tax=unclassified Actinoplanes TaxID=2626549 RepID=UPI003436DA84
MTAPRHVSLDPDGLAGLCVLVAAPTGVVYHHQYGGTACRQGRQEGFLVPLAAFSALDELREIFEVHLDSVGTWNYRWPDEELDHLRRVISEISYWTSDDGRSEEPKPLALDESRLPEADEAWIPVQTPDGPGILIWPNSD